MNLVLQVLWKKGGYFVPVAVNKPSAMHNQSVNCCISYSVNCDENKLHKITLTPVKGSNFSTT